MSTGRLLVACNCEWGLRYCMCASADDLEPCPPPLLCWCCATWGLTMPAVDARERKCARCLNDPLRCKPRHMDEALGTTTEPQPDLFDNEGASR